MPVDNNIVTAAFPAHRLSIVTRSLWQWDYGMTLKFDGIEQPAAYEVHFSNTGSDGNTVTQIGTADGVTIPDTLLTTGMPVYAFVYLHTGEADGETVYTAMVPVKQRPRPSEETPTPHEQSAFEQMMILMEQAAEAEEGREEAEGVRVENEEERVENEDVRIANETAREALADEFRNMTATAETLPEGSDATASYSDGVMTFGIPRGNTGATGKTGAPGADGEDGYSPTVAVAEIDGGHRVTITDANGAHPFNVMDGRGIEYHICSYTEYDPVTRIPTISNPDLETFYLVPAADGSSPDLFVEWVYVDNAWEIFGSTRIDLSGYQTKINAEGILKGNGDGNVTQAVAGTDYGTYSKPSGGIPDADITSAATWNGKYTKPAGGIPATDLAEGVIPDVPVNDVRMNGASVVTGRVADIPAGRNQLGVLRANSDGAYGISTYSTSNHTLVVRGASEDIIKNPDGSNTAAYKPITAGNQHTSVFYGLAKAAGDSTQALSENPTGEYTPEAMGAIQSMLGVDAMIAPDESDMIADRNYAVGEMFIVNGKLYKVTSALAQYQEIIIDGSSANCEEANIAEELNGKADISDIPTAPVQDVQVNGASVLSNGVANIPIAGIGTFGVTTALSDRGTTIVNGKIGIYAASNDNVKSGSTSYRPLVPSTQHISTFYGLAKAAGDTSQSSSSNAVGTYTETALSKISDMLNAPVSVSGSTPSITAMSGVQYVCGEVSTLDITVPSAGIIDVTFESGSTATVLTITVPTGYTLEWANGFDPTLLDADTIYEINIKIVGTKCLGVAAAWT